MLRTSSFDKGTELADTVKTIVQIDTRPELKERVWTVNRSPTLRGLVRWEDSTGKGVCAKSSALW